MNNHEETSVIQLFISVVHLQLPLYIFICSVNNGVEIISSLCPDVTVCMYKNSMGLILNAVMPGRLNAEKDIMTLVGTMGICSDLVRITVLVLRLEDNVQYLYMAWM